MNVDIFFSSNCYGGAVRVARFVYDLLINNGYKVCAFSLSDLDNDGFFNDVNYQIINIEGAKKLKRIKLFYDLLKNRDSHLVISFVHFQNFYITLAAKLCGKKAIISEHGNHTNCNKLKLKLYRYIAYKSADLITFLTKFDMDYFKNIKHKKQILNPFSIYIYIY